MRNRARRPLGARAILAAALALLLAPAAGSANHDRIPDPAPLSTTARLPTGLALDRSSVTVSGLSSGGFFAHQFHVAHSSLVTGAGIIAGGPYGCVEAIPNPFLPATPLDWLSAALVACTHIAGDRFWGARPAPPRGPPVVILPCASTTLRLVTSSSLGSAPPLYNAISPLSLSLSLSLSRSSSRFPAPPPPPPPPHPVISISCSRHVHILVETRRAG